MVENKRFSAIKSALHLLHVAPAVQSVQRKLKADAAAKPVFSPAILASHTGVSVTFKFRIEICSLLKIMQTSSHSGPHEAHIAQITKQNKMQPRRRHSPANFSFEYLCMNRKPNTVIT